MNIHQQLKAKQKAIRVIQSCKTLEQLNSAVNYVRNYNDLFSDMVGYSELKRLIFKKQNLCQKN